MAISHLFPEEGPTLNLNFAGSRTLDPRITFTRTQTTSNGSTYMGRDGLIKYAGPDEPRFHHRYVNGEVESLGLLIEEQRSNLFTYSEDFVNAFPTKFNSSVSIDTNIISPSGTQNVYLFKENSATSQHALQVTTTYQSGFKYCFSVFSKAYGSGNRKLLVLFGAGAFPSQQNATFDLVTGTITNINFGNGTEAKMEKYPNGWYRCTIIGATTTSTAISASNLYLIDENNTSSYTGDNTSGVYIWGAQVEQGSFPTSYIPTEGSTKTRTKDVAYIDGSNFAEWYNQSEGTFFTAFRQIYDASATEPSSTKHVIQAGNDVTVNDNYTIRAGQNSTSWTALIRSASPSSLQFPGISGFGYLNSSTLYKAALSVDISLISVSLNGLLSADVTNTTTVNHTTQFNKLFIGSGTGGSPLYELCGTIAQITYYPTRLTNSQLVALTR